MIDVHVEEIDGRLYVTGDGIEAVPVASLSDAWSVVADMECSPCPPSSPVRTPAATLPHATAGG